MKFDGEIWEAFTPENSVMPYNMILDVVVDNANNKWIALSEKVGQGRIIKITDGNWVLFDQDDFGFDPYYFWRLAAGYGNTIYAQRRG